MLTKIGWMVVVGFLATTAACSESGGERTGSASSAPMTAVERPSDTSSVTAAPAATEAVGTPTVAASTDVTAAPPPSTDPTPASSPTEVPESEATPCSPYQEKWYGNGDLDGSIGIVQADGDLVAYSLSSPTPLWTTAGLEIDDSAVAGAADTLSIESAGGAALIKAGTGEVLIELTGSDAIVPVPGVGPGQGCLYISSERDGTTVRAADADGNEMWNTPGSFAFVDPSVGVVVGYSASGDLLGWGLATGDVVWSNSTSPLTLEEAFPDLQGARSNGALVLVAEQQGAAFAYDLATGELFGPAAVPAGGDVEGIGTGTGPAPTVALYKHGGDLGQYWAGLAAVPEVIVWERNDAGAIGRPIDTGSGVGLVAAVGTGDSTVVVLVDSATGREVWTMADDTGGPVLLPDVRLESLWQTSSTSLIAAGHSEAFGVDIDSGRMLWSTTEWGDSGGGSTVDLPGFRTNGTVSYFDPESGVAFWVGPEFDLLAPVGSVLLVWTEDGRLLGIEPSTGAVMWEHPLDQE